MDLFINNNNTSQQIVNSFNLDKAGNKNFINKNNIDQNILNSTINNCFANMDSEKIAEWCNSLNKKRRFVTFAEFTAQMLFEILSSFSENISLEPCLSIRSKLFLFQLLQQVILFLYSYMV